MRTRLPESPEYRVKHVGWESFPIPPAYVEKALAIHEELVQAALKALPQARGTELKSTVFGGYLDGVLSKVSRLRDTEINGIDGRRIQVSTAIPEPILLGEQPMDYGIWLDLKGWLNNRLVLDACSSVREGFDWYMVEEFTVIAAGMVKDMSLAGAPSLDQLVKEMEKAAIVEGRYLIFSDDVMPSPPFPGGQDVQ